MNATGTSNTKNKDAVDKTNVNSEVSESTPSPSNLSQVEVVQEMPSDSIKIELNLKNTPTNDIQNGNQSSTESEGKTNANGDVASDLTHKTKKSNSKNKSSKSKINENGKNLKQNGVVKVNCDWKTSKFTTLPRNLMLIGTRSFANFFGDIQIPI